ncbi:transglutaminase domain-containing protein [Bacteroides sp. HF-5092]|uniref:transglutaminase domain-containing protein n=1 Tax=Bacteroides TaxID=816 RepID=UPI001178C16E|nr:MULTISPECIES: transglutaminase domain-containing protein [Bacteroides]TRX45261.1 transglutaminase domain-containing protein [Bacteroides sp. HF-5092]
MEKCKVHIQFILVLLLLLLGWWGIEHYFSGEKTEPSLELALQFAGKNRNELEKVLCCYQMNPTDSLKYKAACFLIENMPFYFYSDGEQLENYKSYYAWLKPSFGKTPEQVADSVKKVFGPMQTFKNKRDIMEIDSAYLCHNIDWAFKVWQEQPWGKNISFESFCEYLLPYRIDDEPLVYWREMYYEKYNSLLDSLRMSDTLDKEDPLVAARYLMARLPDKNTYFTSIAPFSFGHIGPEFVQYQSGSCRELTDFAIYLFRALGIPCAIDYLPARGNDNAGHFWVMLWDKNGEGYISDFMTNLIHVRKCFLYQWEGAAKIYRNTFSVNRELHKQMAQYGEEVYSFWRIPKFKDVTFDYAYSYQKELIIPLEKQYKNERSGRIAYLCASNRDHWVPVDWTVYDAGHLAFRYVRNGAVMRVATYEDGALCFLTDPFYMDRETNVPYYYSIGEKKQDVVLYAKSNIEVEDLVRERMIGGVFEGSNRSDFSEKDTLFIIQNKPSRLNTAVCSWSDKEYRYIRYVGPPNGHCDVAEISFYGKSDTMALSGKVMGTPGCWGHDGKHEYTNAFDGKTWTSFDYSEPTGGWTGLDLGRKMQIDRIIYTPRNGDNYVRPGDSYELFYCDRDWKSAGKIKATADSLVFRDVPENALLFLRNYTRGVDERIFIYENETQQWK